MIVWAAAHPPEKMMKRMREDAMREDARNEETFIEGDVMTREIPGRGPHANDADQDNKRDDLLGDFLISQPESNEEAIYTNPLCRTVVIC